MENCVIGIDGGGTATRAAVLSLDGTLHVVGRGGPSNYDDVGEERARENIGAAVAEARRQAGLDEEPFAAAFLGLAGIVSEEDHAVVRRMAKNLDLAAPERVGVGHDARAALAGALSGRPGIVLIAGTGSACYGRTAEGESWMAGGWGHLLADEGSGYWLGVEAMKAAARDYDGRGPATALTARVKEKLGLDEMTGLLHRLYVQGLSRTETGALAPLVVEAARSGDDAARSIIRRGGEELADTVQATAERLHMAGSGFELARAGGLWQAGGVFAEPFEAAIHERVPHARLVPAELPPTLGAGLLALRQTGREVDDDMKDALRRVARAWPTSPAQTVAHESVPPEEEAAEPTA